MRSTVFAGLLALIASAAGAGDDFRFASIDGGEIALADWAGKPVLVVNTASLCGYTGQYDGLQALHDRFAAQGVLILAVPSDDFNQELGDEAEVKEFCATTFDLTLPMTEITAVTGVGAHPFYQWVKGETGFAPRWNFNKVLIGPDGQIDSTFGSNVTPESDAIAGRIAALLR